MKLEWAPSENAARWREFHPRIYSGNLPKMQHEFKKGRLVKGQPICTSCGMYRTAQDYMGVSVHHA